MVGNKEVGAEEMAQWFKAHVTLTEDLEEAQRFLCTQISTRETRNIKNAGLSLQRVRGI